VRLPDGERHFLFGREAGTVELWVMPRRRGYWLPPVAKEEVRVGDHALLHMGPVRPDHPTLTNNSPLSLVYDFTRGNLTFMIKLDTFAGWAVTTSVRTAESWTPGSWHHVACVWDASAERADWLRLYIDGKRQDSRVVVRHEKRFANGAAVSFPNDAPYSLQVGAYNSGRGEADALIDELRISRVARYAEDFIPPAEPFATDAETGALFHFDDSLDGTTALPGGEALTVKGRAGVLAHYGSATEPRTMSGDG